MKTNDNQYAGGISPRGKAIVASLSALIAAQTIYGGGGVPPEAGWQRVGSEWTYSTTPLPLPSVDELSPSDESLIVGPNDNATISAGETWSLTLEDDEVGAIVMIHENALTLDGDLSVSTSHSETQLITGGVLYDGDGELTGDGDLTVNSAPTGPQESSLITAGVLANGFLDVTGFGGAITVTNDNALSNSDDSELEDLGPFGEADFSGSAIAVGIAALNPEALEELDLFGAFEDTGIFSDNEFGTEVFATAVARDESSDGEDDYSQSLSAAVAAGVIGVMEDSAIVEGSALTTVANAGTSTSTLADSEDGETEADSVALSVGFGGVTAAIADDASISVTATSKSATATTTGDESGAARAHSLAGGAGVIGLVEYGIYGGYDTDEGVSISANSTSGKARAQADDYAEGMSAAVSAGIGGVVGIEGEGEVYMADITATSVAGAADVDAVDGLAIANSLGVAAGAIGEVGVLGGSTITANASSALSEADGEDAAKASSVTIASGVLGTVAGIDGGFLEDSIESDPIEEEIVTAIAVTATSNVATANASGDTEADASALAYGVGGFEAFGYVLESVLTDVFGGFLDSDLIASDAIESVPSRGGYGLGGDFTIVANASSATATSTGVEEEEPEDGVIADLDLSEGTTAYAYAEAVGYEALDDEAVYGVTSTMNVTANAGTASATGFYNVSAYSDATAIGIDGDVADYMDGSITTTANAGNATAIGSDYDASLNAGADAYAEGIGSFNGYMDEDAVLDVSAIAGVATAAYAGEVELAPFGAEVRASAAAEAYGMNGSVGEYLETDGIEGGELLDGPLSTLNGTIAVKSVGGLASADSNSSSYAHASASSYGIARYDDYDFDSIESDDPSLLDIYADIDADFDIDAAAGVATATSNYGTTEATADAVGVAIEGVNSLNGSLGGTINVLATTIQAMMAAEPDAVESDAPEAILSADARGAANAYASANAAAIGVGFTESAVMNGDVSADFTLVARAGEVLAGSLSSLIPIDVVASDDYDEPLGGVVASANAVTAALEGVYEVNGDVSGSYVQAAIAGSSTAYSEAMLYNDEIDGEPSMVSPGVVAEATAESRAIDGMVNGTVSAPMTLTAIGGYADAEDLTDTYAHARASAYTVGVAGSVVAEEAGDALTGTVALNSTGGTALASVELPGIIFADAVEADGFETDATVLADASATSYAVDGGVAGDVSADFNVVSTGGTAVAAGDFELSREAIASADSAGVLDGVKGDFTGEMTVTATAGTAIVEETFLYKVAKGTDAVDAYLISNIYANASAIATGLGDGGPGISGDVEGMITVAANGGTAAFISEFPFKMGLPDAIDSDLEDFGPDFDVSAQAIALDGFVDSQTVSSIITATAIGGIVVIQEAMVPGDSIESDGAPYESDASAFAAGIAGSSVEIGELTGGITATATAGIVGYAYSYGDTDTIDSEGGDIPIIPLVMDGYADSAFAAGIMTGDYYYGGEPDAIEGEPSMSYLDVLISTYVHAFVEAPEGEELSEENGYAAAIYSGQGSDYVELADGADIIGDINTGGGLNTVTVTGDTIMEGNILSTSVDWVNESRGVDNGFGTVDFDIDSGLFTAVRTVEISDLEDALEIAVEGGLAPILSQDPEDGDSSLLAVNYGYNGNSADVNLAAGATVLPVFADSVDLNNVLGNEYTIIDAEGIITDNGAIIDNSQTPFEYSLKVIGEIPDDAIEGTDFGAIGGGDEQYVLTVEGVQDQDGEQTPGTVQAAQAISSASAAVMLDVSKHASLLRSLLRRTPASNASNGSAPLGASGPDAGNMRNGDWLSYVSAFGNIGSQDSGSGYAGFDYDTYGLVMGMEKLMGPQLVLGLAGSYASTDIDGKKNSGGGDSDIYSGAVYANWFADTWYVDGGLTYGQADNDVDRIDYKGAKYRGSYDSDLIGTWGEVGYTSTYADFGFEPYGRFTYVYGDHDGFTDKGPDDEVMTTDDNETDNFKTELGARMNYEWLQEDDSRFLVEVKAAWQHEWADRGVSVSTSYLGDANLDIDSADADRDALVLGVRGEWSCAKGLSVGVEYEPTISGNWYNHAFSGTLQYNW